MGYHSKGFQRVYRLLNRKRVQTGIWSKKYKESIAIFSRRFISRGNFKRKITCWLYSGNYIEKRWNSWFKSKEEKSQKIYQEKRSSNYNIKRLINGSVLAPVLLFLLILSIPSISQENQKPQIKAGTIAEEVSKVYKISTVRIQGLKFINPEVIKPLIPFGKGAIVTRDTLAQTLKDLYKLGYFQNVEAYTKFTENGIDLIFVFRELPIVQKIEFEGNEEISDDDLIKELGIDLTKKQTSGTAVPFGSVGPELAQKLATLKKGLGRVFSTAEINEMVKKIKKLYEKEGFYNTKVSYYFRGNTLVFKIDEGKKAYIKKIEIIGNKKVSDREIKKVMETKERNVFFLRFHPRLDKDILYEDIEKIKQLYINKGFLEVEVEEPIIELKHNEQYYIYIKIKEGARYRIQSVKLENNLFYTDNEIFSKLKKKIKPNQYYDGEALEKLRRIIADKYAELGFIFSRVEIEKILNKQDKLVQVIYKIDPGTTFYVDKINISGNYESRDYVIRREMRLAPGDVFLRQKLMRSYSRLYGLGFYDFVGFNPKPKEPKVMDMDIKVKERFTGQMSVGAGYSELTGFSLFGSIKKGNFLGTGDTLGLSLSIGADYRNNELSYIHRWAFYKPIDLGFSLYDRKVEYGTFTSTKLGFSPTVSFEFKEYYRTGVGITIEKGKYSNISDQAPKFIKDQAGDYELYSIYTFLNRNSVDNRLLPTRGSDLTATVKFGTGTRDFYKLTLTGTWFFPDKLFHTDFVFSFKARFGFIDKINKEVPLDELYYVGGDFSLRGFDYGLAGPFDNDLNPSGSKREIIFNYQLNHPIVENFLWAYGFIDQGKGYNSGGLFSDLFYTAGAGIKIITPMAPIDIYYGKILNPPEGVSDSKIGFVLGTFF